MDIAPLDKLAPPPNAHEPQSGPARHPIFLSVEQAFGEEALRRFRIGTTREVLAFLVGRNILCTELAEKILSRRHMSFSIHSFTQTVTKRARVLVPTCSSGAVFRGMCRVRYISDTLG
jgi:hypothetical protein